MLDRSSIKLNTAWQTGQITAILTPSICDKTITWTSSDTSVATVSSTGLVTCVTPWTATITATTVNGLTATCGVTAARLPSAYQEVEWIRSSWTQYINTWKTVSWNVKVEYTYMPNETQTSSSTTWVLFWMDNWWDSNGFWEWNQYLYYWTSRVWAWLPQANTKYDVVLSKQICSRWTFSYTPSSSYPSPSWTLKLFVFQRSWSITVHYKCALYSFKRYDSWTLTQELVPCYRKSDSVIWMYDTVNNNFLTNAGSWTFAKWPDVN